MLVAKNIYPAFATHNALTVATVLEWAGDSRDFEFQRLHGMGEGLYETLVREQGYHTRIYAPVGGHRDLLAYLVRRLLADRKSVVSGTSVSVRVDRVGRRIIKKK